MSAGNGRVFADSVPLAQPTPSGSELDRSGAFIAPPPALPGEGLAAHWREATRCGSNGSDVFYGQIVVE